MRILLLGFTLVSGHGLVATADIPIDVDFHGYGFNQPTEQLAISKARADAIRLFEAFQVALWFYGYNVTAIVVEDDSLRYVEDDFPVGTYRACWRYSVRFEVEDNGLPVPIPFPMPPIGVPPG